MDAAAIARAFSTHDFEAAIPSLADGVVWELVGAGDLTGADAVAKLCRQTAEDLKGVAIELRELRIVAGDGTVVVDTVTAYDAPGDGLSVVASCDLYTFADERLTRIRSYTVELAT